ncbi:hypothetical protein T440DRAFT_159458 [Plenodomus tracheiphilus IPT5]|uniref:Uncharacterized protein n=1 Tax=Plenodomus tracheiphilus IPT5 TaxID=1408161 RepID=A0A6A7BLH0_9PLEO|nr:hypothetical protein T440DRAFT_159458 [Plenodomus tracheiphilus IPT5]
MADDMGTNSPSPRANSILASDDDDLAQSAVELLLPGILDSLGETAGQNDNESSQYDEDIEPNDIKESIEHDFDSQPTQIDQLEPAASMLDYRHQLQDDNTDESTQQHQNEPRESLIENARAGPVVGGSEDSSTLFVPECSPSRPPVARQSSTFGRMLPSVHPLTQSRLGTPAQKLGVFAKIRNMQTKLQNKKDLASRRIPVHTSNIDPDNETYLEAVTQGRLPAVSGAPSVDEDLISDRRAAAEFEKRRRFYDDLRSKARDGKLNFKHDVEWMKIKGAEDARRRKRARDAAKAREEEGDDEGVFPQFRTATQESPEESDHDFDFDQTGPRKRAKLSLSSKQGKPISMLDAELRSMQVGMEAIEEAAVKKKDKGSDEPAATLGRRKSTKSATRSRPSRAKGAPKKGSGKTVKDKREREHALQQASSLFNSNVFTQQAGPNAAEQPGFTLKNKTSALKELIASVPMDSMQKSRSEINILLRATRDFDGRGSVKSAPGTNAWQVKGMRTNLKHYQILGSAFMRRRENAMDEPRGGLLADQMGLGKTLMMLANIVNGQPARGHHGPKTTLIVASPALLSQWKSEIEQHTDKGFKIMRYGAGNRLDSTNAYDILGAHDIILTSYTEVMRSYPKNEPPIICQTAEQKIEWWKDVYEKQRGVLHRMRFLRIVLDEAQAIKNHMGRTSIACRALMATHKWALSGTPILNSLTELYPYFKFLGVPHTGSFKIFKHNYCDTTDPENTERLLVRLSQFMLRRTHEDEMFGTRILKLPQADQDTYWCEFNPVERCIYDIVQARFTKRINMWSQQGELENSYSNALVMLLRLRQLTSHVLMLQFVMRDLLEREDIERIKEITKDHSADTTTQSGRTILAIRKQLDQHAAMARKKRLAAEKAKAEAKAAGRYYRENSVPEEEEEREEEEDDRAVDDEEPAPLDGETSHQGRQRYASGNDFGKNYNFKPFLRSLETGESWEKAKKKSRCSWCSKEPRNPWMTSCGHLICNGCLGDSNLEAAEQEKTRAPCKACGITPSYMHPCDPDDVDRPEAVAQGTRSQAKKKKSQQARVEQEDIATEWLASQSDEILPSAKTIAVKAQIINWTKKNPHVKIIVYTQFLAMIKILARICQKEGWKIEQYHGGMSLPARDKAIASFAENPNTQIMLASLRCGGLGLNLTMASKVIMMDPWWNSASEQQAFCRVFRYGQKEETFMSRLCVNNTVDKRLMDMQERKDAEINAVMENDGKKKSKMSIRDLMRLFGNLEEDAEGRPFIMVDNPDARGGFRADRDDEGYADEY